MDALHPRRLRGRELLGRGRLMLLFTPSLVPGVESAPGWESAAEIGLALDALDACIGEVDALQLRVKHGEASHGRALHAWTLRVLDLCAARPGHDLPLLLNDRVDVAIAIAGELEQRAEASAELLLGVHLGQADLPPRMAREQLGPSALIGLSTHDFAQVVLAGEEPVDYLGFGPIYPTATKGYERGLGPERAWLAEEASALAVYPIGGIGPANASELSNPGRAAVSSAILGDPDPGQAARRIRAALGTG
ncbi:MAG: thiamine phosphate synthase [Planctomycetota bacterium]|nr:thiamine phosphate synthase [Planctomycetota bacterium]